VAQASKFSKKESVKNRKTDQEFLSKMKIVERSFPKKREKCISKHNALITKIIAQHGAA
jgi:hypothetical protein